MNFVAFNAEHPVYSIVLIVMGQINEVQVGGVFASYNRVKFIQGVGSK